MKKFMKLSGVLVMAVLLHIAVPAVAQTDNNAGTTTTATHDNEDDDHTDWGWLGLAGLLGLLGLRKRDDKHVHVERRSDSSNTVR